MLIDSRYFQTSLFDTHGALLFTLHYSEADSFVPAAVTLMSRSCHICTDVTEATSVYLLQFLLDWNVFILVVIYFKVFIVSSVFCADYGAMSTFIIYINAACCQCCCLKMDASSSTANQTFLQARIKSPEPESEPESLINTVSD